MADWSNPKLSSPYVNFLNDLNAKIVEAAAMNPNGTNIPVTAMRMERGGRVFQEWNGSAWTTLPIGVAGGGTGGGSGAEARVNLGFGTMSTQNANGVAITGGSMTGVNLDATYLTSGIIPAARIPDPLPALNSWYLYNLNAGALAGGVITHPDRLGSGATGGGLKYLADNLTWKVVAMPVPRVAHVTATMLAGNPALTVALPYTVQAEKSYIVPETGMIRNSSSTGISQVVNVEAFLCNSANAVVTTGPATHVRLLAPHSDGNAFVQSYRLAIVEWL